MNHELRMQRLDVVISAAIAARDLTKKAAKGKGKDKTLTVSRHELEDASNRLKAAVTALSAVENTDAEFRDRFDVEDLVDTCAEICWSAQSRWAADRLVMPLEERQVVSRIISMYMNWHTVEGQNYGIHSEFLVDDLKTNRSLGEWNDYFADEVDQFNDG